MADLCGPVGFYRTLRRCEEGNEMDVWERKRMGKRKCRNGTLEHC